jgi:hypothetical protein
MSSNTAGTQAQLPDKVAAIKECGFVTWANDQLSAEFRALFDKVRIPVAGIRHVRLWGIQVDDERELPGRERTEIPDEELWEVILQSKDGSTFEVNAKFVAPATA